MTDNGVISPAQRDILIEHIDGRPISLGKARRSIQRGSINGLIHRGLLKTTKVNKWRIETTITEKGRETLAEALAEYADALIRARLSGAFRESAFDGFLERFSGKIFPDEDSAQP